MNPRLFRSAVVLIALVAALQANARAAEPASGNAASASGGGASASGAAKAGEAAPAKPLELRIDYLPNLIYDGERLMLCAAVVNRTPDTVSAEVYSSLAAGATEFGASGTRDIAVPPGKEVAFEADWAVKDLAEIATLSVRLSVGEKEADRIAVSVHPASLAMPEVRLSNEGLTDASGGRVVLVVQRQVPERATRWAVVKWAKGVLTGGKAEPASALFVGDLLAARESDSYVAPLRTSPAMTRFTFLAVPHADRADAIGPAVLETLSEFSRTALKRRYDLAVFFLGAEEPKFGTDPGEFRKAIDLMSGLVRSQGCERVAFVCPVCPKEQAARAELYRRAVMSVSHATGGQSVDPQAAVEKAGWGNGRWPAADAQKAIADEILHFMDAVTVK